MCQGVASLDIFAPLARSTLQCHRYEGGAVLGHHAFVPKTTVLPETGLPHTSTCY